MLRMIAALAVGVLFAGVMPAHAQIETIRVGWCSKTIHSAASPFAVAQKMGWFEKEGIKVDLVPLPGSGDCVKLVATGEVLYGLASVEPLLIIRPQGADLKLFYTAYQGNIYGITVPEASPIKTMADLKGKKIGVIGMGSGGVIVARALAAEAGLDPAKDISIVVAGEGAQTAILLENKQVDALSQFDTNYALVENAGVKLRYFDHPSIARFPSNGFVALGDTLKTKRKASIALAKGYAMGTAFAMANPEAAARILWEMYPQTKPTGKDEATAVRDDVSTIRARAKNWDYARVGAKKWGENVAANYGPFVDWLVKWGVVKDKLPLAEFLVDDMIDEINMFDVAAVEAQAKAWKPK